MKRPPTAQPTERVSSELESDERNQARINDVCLTCRANEEEWTAAKRRWRRLDRACLLAGLVLAALSVALALWLLFFDRQLGALRVLVRRFGTSTQSSAELIAALPLVYLFAECVWLLLELVQAAFSLQIGRILAYDREARRRQPTKKPGKAEAVQIFDDYLTVSSQSNRTLETIHRLRLRVNLRRRFAALRKWFVLYSTLINLLFLLFIVGLKVGLAGYLLAGQLRYDVRSGVGREFAAFVRTDGALYDIGVAGSESVNATAVRDPELERLLAGFGDLFNCASFGNDTLLSAASADGKDCLAAVDASLRVRLLLFAVVFLVTSVLILLGQVVLGVNLHLMLFARMIRAPRQDEERLVRDYETASSRLFKSDVMKKIELGEATMASQFDALLAAGPTVRYANERAKPITGGAGGGGDDEDEDYDEIPADVRNTLDELNRSLESFDDDDDNDAERRPLNRNSRPRSDQTDQPRYQNLDD